MIEAEKANMTITRMCLLLGVDRRRFYEWRARQVAGPSARQQRAVVLTDPPVSCRVRRDIRGAPNPCRSA